MVQAVNSKDKSASSSSYGRSVQRAEGLKTLLRSSSGGQALWLDDGAVSLRGDRLSSAIAGRLKHDIQALGQAATNAGIGVSMMQVAGEAAARIAGKLDEMATLAAEAATATYSSLDRAVINTGFRVLVGEIDEIAAETSFNGILLLQGGSGPGGALQLDFKVGSGTAPEDAVTVAIAPAASGDLAAALTSATLAGAASASAAATAVAAGKASLQAIQGAIAGAAERLAVAASNAGTQAGGLGDARAALVDPSVAVSAAALVAEQVIEEGGVRLLPGAERLFQTMLRPIDEPAPAEPPSRRGTDPPSRSPFD